MQDINNWVIIDNKLVIIDNEVIVLQIILHDDLCSIKQRRIGLQSLKEITGC